MEAFKGENPAGTELLFDLGMYAVHEHFQVFKLLQEGADIVSTDPWAKEGVHQSTYILCAHVMGKH